MKWWLAVLLAAWLQAAWLPFIRPFDVVPNLVLAVIVLGTLRLSVSAGLGIAIVGGLLLDLAGGGWFGWSMLVLTAVVLVIGFVNIQVGWEVDGWWVPVLVTVVATAVIACGIWLSVLAHGGQIEWSVVLKSLLLELVTNIVVVLFGRMLIDRRWSVKGGM